jgi:hypothetical protein
MVAPAWSAYDRSKPDVVGVTGLNQASPGRQVSKLRCIEYDLIVLPERFN